MKALVYRGPNDFALEDVPVPQIIKPDDVIIKVTLSTICTSDVHITHGGVPIVEELVKQQGPLILGHEFCGEIVEVGPGVSGFKPGDRVNVLPGAMCGECVMCKMGVAPMCQNGGIFGCNGGHGCQAEYMRVPMANRTLIPIPEGLTEEDVLFLGDMLCTAWFGIKNAKVSPGQTVAVIGVGPVGQCTCMLAKKVFGAKTVIAFDAIQSRLDAALKAGVADFGFNTLTDEIARKVGEVTGGLGVNATIETPGTQDSFNLACAVTGPGGIISTIAVFEEPIIVPMQEIIYKNLEIKMGIHHCDGVEEMLQMIVDGKLDTKYMHTHRSPLNDIMKGYDIFGDKKDGCIKWLITPYER